MNEDAILMALDQRFVKCRSCKRYINKEINKLIHHKMEMAYRIRRCILCDWTSSLYLIGTLQDFNISLSLLENLYNDLYKICIKDGCIIITNK